MRISVPTLVLPIVCGIVSGVFTTVAEWDALRPALLPAISVIAAAVLVRLARGLPFTNADHSTLIQFRSIASNLESNARKLRALIFVCLGNIAVLILASGALKLVTAIPFRPDWVVSGLGCLISFMLGGMLAYAFTRVIEVVHSDVSLLRLQAGIIETVIANKNAISFEKAVASKPSAGIAGSEKFGRTLPH